LNRAAVALATLATSGAALLVLILFAPNLQAPFLVPKFAALEVTASLAWTAFLLRRSTTEGPLWSRSASLGTLLVLVTSAVAWLAAPPHGVPYAASAMARWGVLFGLACGASVIADAPRARGLVLQALTISAAIVALAGLLQHIGAMPFVIPVISTPGSTFGNRNIAAEVMAMTLPLGLGAAAVAQRSDERGVFYVAILLELSYLAVTRARGAWLGALCGIIATLWIVRPRWSRVSIAAALGAMVAAGLFASLPGSFNAHDAGDRKRYSGIVELFQEGFDPHATALRTRLGLWRRTLSMVRDHPWFGVGPGNWPVEFPRYAEPGAARDGVLSATLAPRQAHDDLLERAAETGVPGLAALGLLAWSVAATARRRLRTCDRDTRAVAAGAAGALLALMALSVASFPLEMPGTLAMSGIALGLVGPTAKTPTKAADARAAVPEERRSPARLAAASASLAVGLVVVSICGIRAERSVRSSRWLGAAERAMRQERGVAGLSEALESLNRALEARPADYRAQLRRSQVLLRLGQFAESAQAAGRAVAVEPYAPNAWAALAAAELASGDHEAARREATRALDILHDFPYALQLRARAAEQEGDLPAAQADRVHLSALAGAGENDTARAAKALLRSPN
jgi:O-antigen ligase